MVLDPFRWCRRRRRLFQETQDELQYLRRRHGASALQAAREKLRRADLTDWGRNVVIHAIKQLEREPKGA